MLKKRITKEEILQKISSEDIFNRYFGPFECYRKSYPSIFRKDKNPSTGFFVNSSGDIVYSDLATGEKWGAISFVMKLFNISYFEALSKIEKDFNINKDSPIINKVRKILPKEDKIIQIVATNWDDLSLNFWADYGITKDELESNNIYNISRLFINDFQIKNENNLPRFAYHLIDDGREYLKIYSPYDKKFKWVTNCPLKIPFGVKDLPSKSDTLIITKSLKDMIVCRKFFSDVIALQNESLAAFDEEILLPVINNYKNVIFWFDCDNAGIEALEKYKEKGFTTFHFPKKFNDKFGVKDPSDFVKKWGLDYFKIFLKQNEQFKDKLLD